MICFIFTEPSAENIFEKSIAFTVELKCENADGFQAFGTAVLTDSENLVTNAHVVVFSKSGETRIFDVYSVRFAFEYTYRQVELIRFDENADLAVLKLKEKPDFAKAVKSGNSDNLKAGETVYAVGNSMNYGLSITQGIVGVPLVEIEYLGRTKTVIQCALTIADGNGGGALLDIKGRLIGITTFRTKDNSGNVVYGLAYCIPIKTIKIYMK
ncbi:MAG: serine protease [Clostridiales bacterium]|nr:serine protease [Clostridiales bacterium]